MEAIDPQKALEMLAQPTKEKPTYTISQLSKNAEKLNFLTHNDPQLQMILDAATRFLIDLRRNSNPRWLVLLGATGTGKTHIAKAINHVFQQEIEAMIIPGQDPLKTQYRAKGGFVSWRKAADRFRGGDYETRGMEENYFLALDDIGAEYKAKSDFITSKLDGILDARLKKWTVITANLTLQQFGEFLDIRIASRLMRNGSEVIEVDTVDFNLR